MKPIENAFTRSLDTASWKREFRRDSARVMREVKPPGRRDELARKIELATELGFQLRRDIIRALP